MAERYGREHYAVDAQMLNRSNQPVVVVAGKIGSGKSTALNNLYGTSFEARSSPTSVTQTLSETSVDQNGVTVRVLDTPGLGGVSLKTEDVARKIADEVRGTDYTLIYCLPVKPSDTLTETDRFIIKSLHDYLGKSLWDKCVLLLTFSDVSLQREFTAAHQVNEYINFLHGHVQAFHRILRQCGADVSRIRATFDRSRMLKEAESMNEIVAVPVMKNRSITGGGFLDLGMSWFDLALSEISRASQRRRRIITVKEPLKDRVMSAIAEICQNPGRAVQEAAANPFQVLIGFFVGVGLGGIYGWYFHGSYGPFVGSCVGAFIGALVTVLVLFVKKQ